MVSVDVKHHAYLLCPHSQIPLQDSKQKYYCALLDSETERPPPPPPHIQKQTPAPSPPPLIQKAERLLPPPGFRNRKQRLLPPPGFRNRKQKDSCLPLDSETENRKTPASPWIQKQKTERLLPPPSPPPPRLLPVNRHPVGEAVARPATAETVTSSL